ncbi:MAG: DUF2905 domain-containing protein [Planctomycetota bacterium]|jgi:hypothetical protein
MTAIGKMLVVAGGMLLLLGVLFVFSDRLPLVGRLPGDISVRGQKTSFHFPIVTCIVVSIVLTALLNLVLWLLGKGR